MTATQPAPAPVPTPPPGMATASTRAPVPSPRPETATRSQGAPQPKRRRSTPAHLRRVSVSVVVALLVAGAASFVAARQIETSTATLRDNAAPVLVATQSLTASLAEAEAAATAAFLAGPEGDPEQRRLYEEALARSNVLIQDISVLIGSDEGAHESLRRLSVRLTEYAGLVEAARAASAVAPGAGDRHLLAALEDFNAVLEDAADLTVASERRFEQGEDERGWVIPLAFASGALALAALAFGSVTLFRRTNRVLNPLVAVAAVLIAVSALGVVSASVDADTTLDAARLDSYESLANTARLQIGGFAAKTLESYAIVSRDALQRAEADSSAEFAAPLSITPEQIEGIRAGEGLPPGTSLAGAANVANTARERAAVAEIAVRWMRYRDAVDALRRAGVASDEARALAVGPVNSAFNGFNFAVEALLADNRDQLTRDVDEAAHRVGTMSPLVVGLFVLAALTVLGGFQVRINEYR